MNRMWKKVLVCLMAASLAVGAAPHGGMQARAGLTDTSENYVVKQTSISRGKIGRSMNVTFGVYNDDSSEWNDVRVRLVNLYGYWEDPGSGREDIYPFESESEKYVGTIAAGGHKSVSVPAKVRADIQEGYYWVEVEVEANGGSTARERVNIYVSQSTAGDTDDTEDVNKQIDFILGEGQSTPYGIYPKVLDFTVNMRNSGLSDARDVTVEMVLDKDSEVFPFDINDGSYNRYFEVVAAGETVQLPYSMAIREDTYSGYYELKYKISYRESATGDPQEKEASFWVRIRNKEKEDDAPGTFDEHSNSMARIVVDSFETRPENIIAGEPFQLILRMKNASADIPASNIMLTLDAEAGSGSSSGGGGGGKVFTTQSGSSSFVINSLAPEETAELTLDMLTLAGIDQRSYYLNIKETYDSPEYKNAESTVSINIPVKQIARLNTGTIEVMPSDITVGAESNIMFPINNTGKVILYNVMVSFEADSIVMPNESYVGNISPGQTGNVDVMLTGAAGTTDDGKVKILITYEDEYGDVQPPVEKELTLNVTELVEPDFTEDFGENLEMAPVEEEPSGIQKYLGYLVAAAVIVVAVIGITLFVRHRKKKAHKKELEELEDSDDEIS